MAEVPEFLKSLNRVQSRIVSRGFGGLFQDWLARRTPGQRKLLLVIVLAIGAYFLFAVVAGFVAWVQAIRQMPNWASSIFGLLPLLFYSIPMIIYASVLTHVLRSVLAWQRFGEFTLAAARGTVRLGEEVEAVVRLAPRTNFELERLVVKLVGTEVAQETETTDTGRDSRTHTYTHRHERVAGEQVVRQGQPLRSDVPYEYRARLKVPLEGMHSFQEGSCAFMWRLVAEACSRSFPDLSRDCEVTVLAEGAGESDG